MVSLVQRTRVTAHGVESPVKDIRLESCPCGRTGCACALSTENNLIWGSLVDRYGEKIQSYLPSAKGYVNLLKQWHHIWYSGYSWSHYPENPTMIHCHSPVQAHLYSAQDKHVNWVVWWESPHVLLLVLILESSRDDMISITCVIREDRKCSWQARDSEELKVQLWT